MFSYKLGHPGKPGQNHELAQSNTRTCANSCTHTQQARAASQAALTAHLVRLEAALGESNRFLAAAQAGNTVNCFVAGTPSMSIADAALVAAVQPLFSFVMGVEAQRDYTRIRWWLQEAMGKQPAVAKVMGELQERKHEVG